MTTEPSPTAEAVLLIEPDRTSPTAKCGHVGCCDDSKNKHATKHFPTTQHPIMFSFEPGEAWGYCYVDDYMFESSEPING
jgi:uncharacterized UBP type Zn finger protein